VRPAQSAGGDRGVDLRGFERPVRRLFGALGLCDAERHVWPMAQAGAVPLVMMWLGVGSVGSLASAQLGTAIPRRDRNRNTGTHPPSPLRRRCRPIPPLLPGGVRPRRDICHRPGRLHDRAVDLRGWSAACHTAGYLCWRRGAEAQSMVTHTAQTAIIDSAAANWTRTAMLKPVIVARVARQAAIVSPVRRRSPT
jgi:hypothetical protein